MKKYVFGILFTGYILIGCASTDYQRGRDAFDRGDYDTAVKEFRSLAEQNDPRGQYALAIMYDLGEGVPKNPEEALKYYRLAAEQGNADAQNNLGVMYDQGEGVSVNYKEAMKWYLLAAEQGNRDAPNNIGVMYMIGLGVPRDFAEAHKWFTIAGASDIEAKSNKKFIESRLTPEQITESERLASEWHKKVENK
ncbi:MAG: sel1 repeat family protein [Nitrospinae bacterium]|nr:sel1 repeat family protein [Nitrospinota bacterium]